MKTPCEVSMWYVVPYIRSQIALSMVNEMGLRQAHAAKKLGVTDAAVSQYISGKRAKTVINEDWLQSEIRMASEKIANVENEELITEEICRICKKIQDSPFMDQLVGGACGRCP